MPYDPIPDSNREGRRRLVMELDPATGPLIMVKSGECWCGCHERPARQRRFKPGHDTRFRGILQRAHRAGVPVTLVVGGKRFEHSAERWWQALQLRKESEAVRRRTVRRSEPGLAWMQANGGKTYTEIAVEMMEAGADDVGATELYDKMLVEVKRLCTLDNRRFKLD